MQLRRPSSMLLWAAVWGACAAAKESDQATATAPCTARTTNDGFFDLRPDIAIGHEEGEKRKAFRTADYTARGYDYNANFTLNLCAALVKPPKEAVGISDKQLRNVSAYYEKKGKVYSLGLESSVLISRGPEVVLQYSGGSPCPDLDDLDKREAADGESKLFEHHVYEDRARSLAARREKETKRRKSATFEFRCDRDGPEAAVVFVHTPDECAYFFRVRSMHACAGVEPHRPGSVGPGGVFAIIFFVALLVYFIGGVFYQRTVAHARGWRQLPNYSLWAGIWSFVSDVFVILTSSCARFLPNRRGYHTLSGSPRGRGRDRDAENRLIDQLDEEWDD